MVYSDDIIEEVRGRSDIVDVISGYVRLTRKGSSYFGLCPFHNEKSPSFSVSGSKQMFYCFGCGEGGNVFSFIMKYENYTFPEAVKLLADRAGVQLPEVSMTSDERRQQDMKAQLYDINKEAALFYYKLLKSPGGQRAYDYFKNKRVLSDETIVHFGLGASGTYKDELYRYMKNRGYSDDLLRETGLFIYNEREVRDRFFNRAMFPIMNISNKVIGFGGRVMGEGEPKYLNSPETKIFDKGRNLFGLNFARSSRKKNMIICEGYMDVIAMHQAGFTQAVASLGTAFTAGQANMLRRYAREVILAYDSDGAGVNAALRAIGILKEVELTGKVLNLEPYKDPDEFIKHEGAEKFQQRINEAENSFFFELRILQRDYNLKDPESKTQFHREIAKKLCEFSEDVERDNYIQAVADKYLIGYENLRKLVMSYALKTGNVQPAVRPKSGIQPKNTPDENRKKPQKLFLTWLVEEPQLYPRVKQYISVEDFTEELYRKVAERLFEDLDKGEINPAAIVSLFNDMEEQREVAGVFNTKLQEITTKQDREKAFHDILVALKRNSYEYFSSQLGADVNALKKAIEGKKALEELEKTHISLD